MKKYFTLLLLSFFLIGIVGVLQTDAVEIEIQKIYTENEYDHKAMWAMFLGAAFVIFIFIYWNTKLKILNQKLANTKKELELALSKAEKASIAKSAFVANISHEIRTPLNAVLGFAELLEKTNTDEKQKYYLSSIKSSGKMLLKLINDILDISKIEAGKIEINHSPLSIKEMFYELELVFKEKSKEKALELEFFIDSNFPVCFLSDKARLAQVLFNLLGNAIKFTNVGKITVLANCVEKKNNRAKIEISVVDTGIGISPFEQQLIFEAFEQSTLKTQGLEGTGLGLSISKRLVEKLGGEILLKSELGSGSRFSVVIDSVAICTEEVLHSNALENVDINFTESILLVVDDVARNRELVKGILESTAIRIVEASSGEEALKVASYKKIDLVLLDIAMPDMDGYECAKELRAIKGFEKIPLIAFSAMPKDKKNFSTLFDDYLSKPFSAYELKSLLARYLPHTSVQEPKSAHRRGSIEEIALQKITAQEVYERFFTKWNEARKNAKFEEITAFAKELKAFASEKNEESLEKYAEEIISAVDKFDISVIKKLMGLFQTILPKKESDV